LTGGPGNFSIAAKSSRKAKFSTYLGRETTDMATLLPYTGKEFLDSLDDGREV